MKQILMVGLVLGSFCIYIGIAQLNILLILAGFVCFGLSWHELYKILTRK